MTNLTPKQQQIYQFIRASTQANGYPPTLREIGQQVGVRSPSTVKYHLDNLRTLGLLHWDGGKELPEPAGEQLGLGHVPLLQPPPPTGVEGRVPNQQVGGTGAEGKIGKGRDERLALGRGEI